MLYLNDLKKKNLQPKYVLNQAILQLLVTIALIPLINHKQTLLTFPTPNIQLASYFTHIQTPPTPCSQPANNPFHCPYTHPTHIFPSPKDWLIDSGATYHVTPRVADLQSLTPYQSQSSIVVANGNVVPISHVRYKSISQHSIPLHLNKIFLISVSKLCNDNNAFVELHPDYFLFKDKTSKCILF